MLWQLRAPEAGDVSFVFSSWLRSFRDGPVMANMDSDTYYAGAHAAIETIAQSPNSRVVIASDPAEPGVIYGYGVAQLVGTELVLHWIYAKHAFRGFGLAAALEAELLKIPHTSVAFSCWPKFGSALLKNRRHYRYNPFYYWGAK